MNRQSDIEITAALLLIFLSSGFGEKLQKLFHSFLVIIRISDGKSFILKVNTFRVRLLCVDDEFFGAVGQGLTYPFQAEFREENLEDPVEHSVLVPGERFESKRDWNRFADRLLNRPQVNIPEHRLVYLT
ncbi:hypothetical protein ES708_15186 [subsurface metagenome]